MEYGYVTKPAIHFFLSYPFFSFLSYPFFIEFYIEFYNNKVAFVRSFVALVSSSGISPGDRVLDTVALKLALITAQCNKAEWRFPAKQHVAALE